MGLTARMTDTVTVYARARGADTWAQVDYPLPALITALNASGQRRESTQLDPEVTHMGRLPLSADGHVSAGNRLRRSSDGAEWVVRFVRAHGTAATKHVAVGLAHVEPVIGG